MYVRGEVKIRLIRDVQLRIPRVLSYTYNRSGAIIHPEVFAHRGFAWPMSSSQRFINDDDSGITAGILLAKCAAIQQRDPQRGEVIRRDDIVCCENSRFSLERHASIRSVVGTCETAAQWYVANPHHILH